MSDGIADAQTLRAMVQGIFEQARQHLGTGARRIFGDVGTRQAVLHREVDRLSRQLEHPRLVPVFGVQPNWRGADKGHDLHRNAGALRDLGDGADVV